MTKSRHWLLASGGPIRERVLRGGAWALAAEILAQASGFLRLVLLARLLSPHDFGLMGIALASMKWLEYFTDAQLNAALIREQEDIRPYLDTAWTLQVVRGSVLTLILVLGAPLAAAGFGEQTAAPIIRGIAAVLFIQGCVNPAVVSLRRELNFRRDTLWKLTAVAAGLCAAIVTAFALRNAWALVWGLVATEGTAAILSYKIQPYRPRFAFQWARARRLLRFGKWMFWVRVSTLLCLYLDTLMTARLLGVMALGFYQAASQLAVTPAARFVNVVGGVMYPAFARLQGDPALRYAPFRMVEVLSTVLLPAACFLTAFATPLVSIVLGTQWLVIVRPLQILAWTSAAAPLSATAQALVQAIGKPELSMRMQLVRLLALTATLYPLAMSWNISGVAAAVTLSHLAAAGYGILLIARVLRPRRSEFFNAFKLPALASAPLLAAWTIAPSHLSPGLFVIAGITSAISATIVTSGLRSRLVSGGQAPASA